MANKFKLPKITMGTKSRTLWVIIILVLVVGGLITFFSLEKDTSIGGSRIGGVPRIESVPGAAETTREYGRTVRESNILEAEKAAREGTSAVPTITGATYFGVDDYNEFDRRRGMGTEEDACSVEALKRAREAGVKADELRCKGCDAQALLAAGYTPGELREAGFTAEELRNAGVSAGALAAAGFDATTLKQVGFSDSNLRAAGFAAAEIDPSLVNKADCSVESLRKARADGVSAGMLKARGCGAKALKAAGFTAAELRDAGFSAGELRDAGYTAKELKDGGFSAKELRAAGFSAAELKEAGFTAQELLAAGFTKGDLARAGFTAAEINPELAEARALAQMTAAERAGVQPTVGVTTIPTVSTATGAEAVLRELQAREAAGLSAQDRSNLKGRVQVAMASQASDLFSSWTASSQQAYVLGEAPKEETGAQVGGAGATAELPADQVVKAGQVMFAVLDTGVNTDEISPIMATISLGPLKGAKLVGTVKRVGSRAILQFTAISMNNWSKSLVVDAVAIDPDTARTALADDVNHHRLLRFGTLFASAFLKGMGEAIADQGTTTIAGFTTVTESKDLSVSEQAAAGLGEVGKETGKLLAPMWKRPPTVKVDAARDINRHHATNYVY